MRVWRRGGFLLLVLCATLAGCKGDATPTNTASPTPAPTNTAEPAIAAVYALADVALRSGPGPDFAETLRVLKATELSLLGHARGNDCQEWALVRTPDGEEGWVRPVLVNVDVSKSTFPTVPVPTPANLLTPIAVCTDELALVQINNKNSADLEVFMAGAELGFTLPVGGNSSMRICLTPGEYCYDITDGEKHDTGELYFPPGECTCWHWGGGPPTAGSCTCADDPSQYQRP